MSKYQMIALIVNSASGLLLLNTLCSFIYKKYFSTVVNDGNDKSKWLLSKIKNLENETKELHEIIEILEDKVLNLEKQLELKVVNLEKELHLKDTHLKNINSDKLDFFVTSNYDIINPNSEVDQKVTPTINIKE